MMNNCVVCKGTGKVVRKKRNRRTNRVTKVEKVCKSCHQRYLQEHFKLDKDNVIIERRTGKVLQREEFWKLEMGAIK